MLGCSEEAKQSTVEGRKKEYALYAQRKALWGGDLIEEVKYFIKQRHINLESHLDGCMIQIYIVVQVLSKK